MAAGSAVLLALAFPASSLAGDTLDRSVPDSGVIPTSTAYLQMAQMAETFTPTLSGQMDKVALYVGSANFNHPNFRLEIWTVDPTASTLAGVGAAPAYQFQAGTAKTWQTFTLTPSVHVDAGKQYALVVTQTSFPLILRWGFMSNWSYAGSNMWLCCGWTKDTSRNFAFQEYVDTGSTPPSPSPTPAVNHPPQLDPPATLGVRVDEGTQPSNHGTYSDADGDNVSFTASLGSVTKTGSSQGTWTWTQPASDEAATQTVTITANDGHNPGVGVNFTVQVQAVAPTASITTTGTSAALLNASTAIKEGTPLSFWGGGHSLSPEDNAAGFTYRWTVTKDGAAYPAGGTGASFTFTPDDEGSYVVTLAATDDGGLTGTTTTTVNVLDVLPTAIITAITPALSAPQIVVPNELVTFSGTYTDPGTADPHTATWKFGDGTSVSGWTVSHFYTSPGVYTVTLEIGQGDDPPGTTTATVTVLTPAQALDRISAYVQSLPGLNAGQKNSLVAKLNAASAAIGRGNNTAATNQLNAFLNELQADVNTGKVSAADAGNLGDDIRAVKAALGSYNRFLDLWPLGL